MRSRDDGDDLDGLEIYLSTQPMHDLSTYLAQIQNIQRKALSFPQPNTDSGLYQVLGSARLIIDTTAPIPPKQEGGASQAVTSSRSSQMSSFPSSRALGPRKHDIRSPEHQWHRCRAAVTRRNASSLSCSYSMTPSSPGTRRPSYLGLERYGLISTLSPLKAGSWLASTGSKATSVPSSSYSLLLWFNFRFVWGHRNNRWALC